MYQVSNRDRLRINRVLAALRTEGYKRLIPLLSPISMTLKQILYHPNGDIPYVYFSLTMVTSLVVRLQDGQVAEVATVGKEGMVGLPSSWVPTPSLVRHLRKCQGRRCV